MNYHDIKYDDMLNGEGLRIVLFVSGCNHNCYNCHNPETHDPESGIPFTTMEENEILMALDYDYISGITLSGGDPLYPGIRKDIDNLIDKIRKYYGSTKNIWLYTGYTWDEIIKDEEMRSIVSKVDVVVDGKYVEKLADVNCPWVGSINQRIINAKESLKTNSIILTV